jgi:hypothetical protein
MRRLDVLAPNIATRSFLAEDFKDWMRSSTYDELFTFEQDLAALASLIIIFVESDGAIAELGAFSAIPQVHDKLLIFLQTQHYQSESFIRLGLLDFLISKDPASVCAFPWKTIQNGSQKSVVQSSIDDCLEEISESITLALKRNNPRQFKTDRTRDQMLLISDLVDQMIGLQLNEIQEFMRIVGIPLDTRTLKQRLYVLKKLDFVEQITRGHTSYYVASKSQSYVKYGFYSGSAKYDRERVRAEIARYYMEHDPVRIKALASILTR